MRGAITCTSVLWLRPHVSDTMRGSDQLGRLVPLVTRLALKLANASPTSALLGFVLLYAVARFYV